MARHSAGYGSEQRQRNKCHLFVAAFFVGSDGRQFQTIQRALAGQRFAPIPVAAAIVTGRVGLADQYRQERIEAKGVVVIEIFVAQGQGKHPLSQQIVDRMFDQIGIAVVGKTGRKSSQNARLGFHLPQK